MPLYVDAPLALELMLRLPLTAVTIPVNLSKPFEYASLIELPSVEEVTFIDTLPRVFISPTIIGSRMRVEGVPR